MLSKLIFNVIFIVSIISFNKTDGYIGTAEELRKTFGSKICIEGSLVTIGNKASENFVVKESGKDYKASLINTTVLERTAEVDKSSLSKLNEVAQYNELRYFYKLEKEEGPPHDKVFTISLTLGEEKYISEGKSLKKAQQNVAALALETTKYVMPPIKDQSENTASLTPTVLLNNLCMKLGMAVKYFLVDKEKQEILNSNMVVNEKSKKSYIQKLNESIYSTKNIRMKKDVSQIKGPFKVKVQVGEHFFYGYAHTIQSARHEAASNALDFLIKNKDNLNSDCLNEDSENCRKVKESLKSPISLVHEAAQQRKMDIEFEIIEERGPAHKKTFVTQCRLGHLTTVGEGNSKKESKKIAAENMLERIPELPPVSQEMQVRGMMKSKNKKKKKKNKIIKNKFEEIGMAVEDFVGSVFGFGKEDSESGNQDIDENTDSKPKKISKPKHPKQSYQDELLELSNFLNIEIHYSDFKEDKYYSVLSLYINPDHICYGQGLNEKEARDKAADGALDLLYSLGLYDHFDERYNSLEGEIKESVQTVLRPDISDDTK